MFAYCISLKTIKGLESSEYTDDLFWKVVNNFVYCSAGLTSTDTFTSDQIREIGYAAFPFEYTVLSLKSLSENKQNNKATSFEDAEDYIIPFSNIRELTEDDILGLSLQEINYAKNEIYARAGRKFNSQELQNYFSTKSWYNGIYEPTEFRCCISGKVPPLRRC